MTVHHLNCGSRARQGDEVTLICPHDPHELEREQAKAGASAAVVE